jgi:hypothetical protein
MEFEDPEPFVDACLQGLVRADRRRLEQLKLARENRDFDLCVVASAPPHPLPPPTSSDPACRYSVSECVDRVVSLCGDSVILAPQSTDSRSPRDRVSHKTV